MKIILVCAGGLSSSLLVSKMKHEGLARNLTIDISAVGEPELLDHTEELDVVLIAPQIRYLEKKIKQALEPLGIKVAVIDGMAYGRLKGDVVLDQALALVE
ncbi:PTS sugar transporter subunit IIB [Paraliobacillus sp. JSM ZJ581]|uniref:PTS sugar transporter subunit IIB n=1 Tax=Paraliobacillus sp. JSM ZJ581 TaxID=3342118 RepID=UPI0035A855F1